MVFVLGRYWTAVIGIKHFACDLQSHTNVVVSKTNVFPEMSGV